MKPLSLLLPPKHRSKTLSSSADFYAGLRFFLQVEAIIAGESKSQRPPTQDFFQAPSSTLQQAFFSCRGFDQRKKFLSRLSYQHTTSPSSAAGDTLSGKVFRGSLLITATSLLSNRGIVSGKICPGSLLFIAKSSSSAAGDSFSGMAYFEALSFH